MEDIKIAKSVCTHLKEISFYNHNYYLLPFSIDGCDVVYEICDEYYDDYEYVLGTQEEGAFKNDGKHIFYSCGYGFDKCDDFIILEEEYKNVYAT